MRRHCPVFLQPRFDVELGNGLLAVFYHWDPSNVFCILSIVYESEASYEVRRETRLNQLGTLLYRTHNYRRYHRTADIKHLAFHGCRLGAMDDSDPGAWESLHSLDFSGAQRWSAGAKLRFLYFYSLVHHYEVNLQRDLWRTWDEAADDDAQRCALQRWREEDAAAQKAQLTVEATLDSLRQFTPPAASSSSSCQRPVVFINTMNHLLAPWNANPHLPLTVHCSYPTFPGERSVAEKFGQLAVRYKPTLFSLIPNLLYSPIPSDLRAERRRWARLHHTDLLEGRVRGPLLDDGQPATEGKVALEQKADTSSHTRAFSADVAAT